MVKSVEELDAEFRNRTEIPVSIDIWRMMREAQAEVDFLKMEIRRAARSCADPVVKKHLLELISES